MGIDKTQVVQIGLLVRDIKEATAKWAQFLGVPVPEPSKTMPYDKTKATYYGKRCDGLIWQTAFTFGNIEIELLQPIDKDPSIWRDCLDRDGEGLHHIAFEVKNMAECLKETEAMGYSLIQKGEYENGRYAYMDAIRDMKLIIEYLEHDDR